MYLKRFTPAEPFWSNVKKEFFTKSDFLYEETEFLLRQEPREPRNYFLILRAVADGWRKLGEIANETGLDKAAVSRYLYTLELLGLVGYKMLFPSRGFKSHPRRSSLHNLCKARFWKDSALNA